MQIISERLKAETAETHRALEAVIVKRIRSAVSKQDYARLLTLFYGYYSPIEDAIIKYIGTDLLPDIGERRKADWLLADIMYIRGSVGPVELSSYKPDIASVEQAVGAMYVLEGSTLGGKHIIKMISKNLDISGAAGFDFYNSYGDNTISYWQNFTQMLNGVQKNEKEQDEIIASANDTFSCFQKWIEKNHP